MSVENKTEWITNSTYNILNYSQKECSMKEDRHKTVWFYLYKFQDLAKLIYGYWHQNSSLLDGMRIGGIVTRKGKVEAFWDNGDILGQSWECSFPSLRVNMNYNKMN